MNRSRLLSFSFWKHLLPCLAAASFLTLSAQQIKPTQEQLRESLVAASKLSALESEGTPPFRLSATFTTFDYKGKPAGEGTLDEAWLKPGTARRKLTIGGHTQVQISRDGSVRYTGEDVTGSPLQRRVVDALLQSVPAAQDLPQARVLDYKPLKLGNSTLDCVLAKPRSATEKSSAAEAANTAFCMDAASHIVRIIEERYDFAIVYNKLVKFGDHIIAQDIRISQRGTVRAALQVTGIGAAPDLKDADFVIPANAVDLSREDVEVPGSVTAGGKISGRPPLYPAEARRNHISGTVVLSGVIGTDGRVRELDVVSSPSPDLTDSAINAVKDWRYKPYLLNGTPTQVQTTFTVNFSFG